MMSCCTSLHRQGFDVGIPEVPAEERAQARILGVLHLRRSQTLA